MDKHRQAWADMGETTYLGRYVHESVSLGMGGAAGNEM